MYFDPQGPNRRFGAPVLYMQSAEGVLLVGPPSARPSQRPSAGGIRPPAQREPDVDIRQLLLDATVEHDRKDPDPGIAQWFADEITRRDWPSAHSAARRTVDVWARDHADDRRLRPWFAALRRALREAKGPP